MRRLAIGFAVLAASGLVAAAYGQFVEYTGARPQLDQSGPAIRITGSVSGIQPGYTEPLVAEARNRTPYVLRILWIQARVGDAEDGCDRTNLRSRRIRVNRVVAPYGVRQFKLQVRLRAAAPDQCQDAAFPLRFAADVVPGRSAGRDRRREAAP